MFYISINIYIFFPKFQLYYVDVNERKIIINY